MTQIAVKLSQSLMDEIDALVEQGTFDTRSAAVRAGMQLVARQARRARVDQAFADGFAALPESATELTEAERLAVSAIDEEPWEPWW